MHSVSTGAGISRKPLLKNLTDALYHKVADKWKVIGILLEIPTGTLSGIAEKCRDDPQNCLATWTGIIEAVEFLGEKQLGKELRDKYCPTLDK